VLCGKVVMGQQRLPVFQELPSGLRILGAVGFDEPVHGEVGSLLVFGHFPLDSHRRQSTACLTSNHRLSLECSPRMSC
jgi:hypothetical protein